MNFIIKASLLEISQCSKIKAHTLFARRHKQSHTHTHVIVWSKQKKTIVPIIDTSVSAVASYLAGDGGPHFERVVV